MALLVVVAFVTRFELIGDPAYSGDEEFYLVVADRMWHGALPFVDVWDRKPVGLFLLYALFRPLSADGVVATQIAALLFAAVTAWLIARVAARVAGPVAAVLAGVLYLGYIPLLGGGAGQSPVFYNLFMAAAALLIVEMLARPGYRSPRWLAPCAMLLVGVAIQVKYIAVIEGVLFGLTLLWLRWRARRDFVGLALHASWLVAVALLPTALAFGFYLAIGHGREFFTANFVSIFLKREPAGYSEMPFLVSAACLTAPLLLIAGAGVVRARTKGALNGTMRFALVWSCFAFAEFFVLGHYFAHYALPLTVPLSILAAPALENTVVSFFPVVLIALNVALGQAGTAHKSKIDRLTEALAPYARQGCIYVYDGPPILYLTTGSCLPSRFVFPGHLLDEEEKRATDAARSMATLLRSRPSAIVVGDRPTVQARNTETAAMVQAVLAKDYRLKLKLPDTMARNLQIFVRNDLP